MLRHRQHLGDLAAVDRTQELCEVLPRFRNPVVVEFRRGGDLSRVVNAIGSSKYIEIGAAVGSGKSTKCPSMIAEALGCLVIHTIPFHVAARALADYLKTTAAGVGPVAYVDDVGQALPSGGVVLMSTQHFHARWFHNKFADVEGSPLLYMDEVHESDCFTAVLRDIAPGIRKFRGVVRATATSNPDSSMRPDLPGVRVERTYPRCSVAKWSATDRGRPWSADDIVENTVICVDRVETRERLASEYRNQGFVVRVCTSLIEYDYFVETLRLLNDPVSGVVVVLVDYAYRSSFSIAGASNFIDSCEVAVPYVEKGFPAVKYRPAYDFEVQQFLGRGGRFPGQRAVLYRCVESSPKYMCDLECLEAVAANLLFRMYGFRPPVRMDGFAYFSGKVPKDLAGALASNHPLELCPEDARVAWVVGGVVSKKTSEMSVPGFQYAWGQAKEQGPAKVGDPAYDKLGRADVVGSSYGFPGLDLSSFGRSLSRAPSPEMATVFTLNSEYDNLAAFQDPENPPFARSKRVANHIRKQREQALRDLETKSDQQESVGVATETPSDDGYVHVAEHQPQQVQQSVTEVALAGVAGQVGQVVERQFVAPVLAERVRALVDVEQTKVLPEIPDDYLGSYVYYPGVGEASHRSATFVRGLQSIIAFCDGGEVRHRARGLLKEDKLYAMRKLVDEFNEATAVAMGIQRLFAEMSARPPDTFSGVLDSVLLAETFDRVAVECASAQARARSARDLMPVFMDYAVTMVSAGSFLDLEQQVMVRMMETIEKAAVKRDPDKLSDYIRAFNQRTVKVHAFDVARERRSLYRRLT